MLKRAAKEAVIIIMAASIIGLITDAVRPDKAVISSVANVPHETVPLAEEQGVATISIDEAFDLYQKGNAIFADARHGVDYAAGHIHGAINLMADESAPDVAEFLSTTDPTTPIITYCDGEHCRLAPELAQLLFFNGFDHVFYIENGWTRWRERGYPVE